MKYMSSLLNPQHHVTPRFHILSAAVYIFIQFTVRSNSGLPEDMDEAQVPDDPGGKPYWILEDFIRLRESNQSRPCRTLRLSPDTSKHDDGNLRL